MNEKKWMFTFFGVLLIFGFLFFTNKVNSANEQEIPMDSTLVKYYWNLDDGTSVFYEGYVKQNGLSTFELTGVCSSITNECREPSKQEIEVGHYIPQSQEG